MSKTTRTNARQGTRRERHNAVLTDWIKARSQEAELVLSVCTGALLLAKAGLLDGLEARLAGEVGLDEKEFEEALGTRKYGEAHRRSLRHAYEGAGVTGVPMYAICSKSTIDRLRR